VTRMLPFLEQAGFEPHMVFEPDIGIIPIDPTREPDRDLPDALWRVRSENRLTMKMCVGLPVAATPVPAYEVVVHSGKNGFLCSSRDEWLDALTALRDPDLRREVGERARRDVLERYSKEEQARQLIRVLKGLVESPATRV